MKNKNGFTLIEILIVMAIIAMLAAIVVVAINPARQFAQARNTQRWATVNTVLNSVNQNMIDNKGVFTCANPIPVTAKNIADSTSDPAGVDLCNCLVPTYVASMPYDPTAVGASYTDCTTYNAGYTILQSATTGRITVAAPAAELGTAISATR